MSILCDKCREMVDSDGKKKYFRKKRNAVGLRCLKVDEKFFICVVHCGREFSLFKALMNWPKNN